MHTIVAQYLTIPRAVQMPLLAVLCLFGSWAHASDPREYLLSLDRFRQQVETDSRLATHWATLRQAATLDLREPAWTPASALAGREASHVRRQNPNDGLIRRVGRRLERAALVYRITGDRRYLRSAWRQMAVLFDEQCWPDWRDLAHREGNSRVDLRTGDLSAALGITYDWLREDLTAAQRDTFLVGVNRQVLDPFLKNVDEQIWWLTAGHNWTTRIVGGIGILSLALRDDEPRANQIVSLADQAMNDYLDHLGSDGSFNESPGYVGDLAAVARYFWVRGNEEAKSPALQQAMNRLVGTVHWTVWTLLPGFRQAAFGDTWTKRPRSGDFAGAIAAASSDGLAQWLFLSGNGMAKNETDPRRLDPEAVLAYNPVVAPTPPSEVLPLARAFTEQGGLLLSRTGWDLSVDSRDVVIYGKHGRAANHDHDDVGQVAMTIGTQPIIAEVGKNFTYPADFFGPNRRAYYPAAARGHNVITFGEADDGGMLPNGRGELLFFRRGDNFAHWRINLSGAYGGERKVIREVLHVLPAVLVVLDEVVTSEKEEITLRWHTGSQPQNDGGEQFSFRADDYQAVLRTVAIQGEALRAEVKQHQFKEPFDTSRDGEQLPQYHEPYVSLTAEENDLKWLTLIAATDNGMPPKIERTPAGTWLIATQGGRVTVQVTPNGLTWERKP